MTPYQPIDCDVHDHYEIAIMGGQRMDLLAKAVGEAPHWLRRVKPVDLQARGGEEFLLFEHGPGGLQSIRLDGIVDFNVVS